MAPTVVARAGDALVSQVMLVTYVRVLRRRTPERLILVGDVFAALDASCALPSTKKPHQLRDASFLCGLELQAKMIGGHARHMPLQRDFASHADRRLHPEPARRTGFAFADASN